MARTQNNQRRKNAEKTNPVPPGATKAASDHDLRPGEPPDRTPGGEEAAGTPGGGTEVGGLAGTNIDDGDPALTNLDRAMGSGARGEDSEEGDPPYAGGHQRHGIRPGSKTPADRTIGERP